MPLVAQCDRHIHPIRIAMHVRCPDCLNSIELIHSSDFQNINCLGCGSRFALVDTEQDKNETLSEDSDTMATIGHFELVEEVGRGAFGSVWRARDTELDRPVAVKMSRQHQLSADGQEQFLREARAIAQLSHPNIVRVHEVGREGEQLYIVSEFLEGITLAERLTTERLSQREAAELCMTIATALEHAHENGVIHRDLKPANIMLLENNRPLVMDFGMAKRDVGEITITMDGRVLGTPAYMPPEQARGEGHHVDGRADVYSLGIVLYELLSGELPFRGAMRLLLHQVIHDEVPSPRKLDNTIPRDLETITLKCLQKAPSRRYQSAAELAADLECWLSGKPIKARPVTWMERSWQWCHRKPAAAALIGLSLSVLCILIVGSLWYNRKLADERDRANQQAAKAIVARDAEARERANAEAAQGIALKSLAAQVKAEEDRRIGQANALWQSTPQAAATILQELHGGPGEIQNSLRGLLHDSRLSSLQKNRIRLGLLAIDHEQLDPIVVFLLSPTGQQMNPEELLLIRSLLEPFGDLLTPRFVPLLEQPEGRLRAACLLAGFVPQADFWPNQSAFIAEELVNVLPSELASFRELLRPVKQYLVAPLSVICRDDGRGEQVRLFATDTLADYLSNDPAKLFDLLADANQKIFSVLYDKLTAYQEQVVELGNAQIAIIPSEEASEEDKEVLAIRHANAAVMLLRMGVAENVWPLLRHSPDPRARSYIIHWSSPLGVESAAIVARYKVEPDVTIKRALLLSLGEFDESQLDKRDRDSLISSLLSDYRNNKDAGLHAATEWLLKHWGQAEKIASMDKELQQNEQQLQAKTDNPKQWYINGQGQTFVILDAAEFRMGAPESEQGRDSNERVHRRQIGRRYAISTKEVTKAQWDHFSEQFLVWSSSDKELVGLIRTEDSPMVAMTWYEAAGYCNWLSQQEGVPRDQWCYQLNEKKRYGPGMKAKENFLELRGYRLPTEAEWEYACRAGTTTSRSFGQSDTLLSYYAWYQSNSERHSWPVASLKPNDFGLFDMHGNVWEWCYDQQERYPVDAGAIKGDAPGTDDVSDAAPRVLRGASHTFLPRGVRSANRNANRSNFREAYNGFRPARTYPLAP